MQFSDFADRVHKEVAIESYISRYVNLKRRGKKMVGLCPFHTEKTPSFTVSPDVQLYYCFGCHKSGDIFRFVMDYEKVDFNRAKEILSEYSGIPLAGKKSESFDELYELNKKTADFYHRILLAEQGKEALAYLHERKLSESDIELFQLGYAPAGYENLVLKMSPDEIKLAEKVGLVKERPKMKGSYYDFFRDRIMFPIKDVHGRVTGFGGRIFGSSEEAKYINSPSSPIYDKGRTFFNLHGAVDSIKKSRRAILVEGYMDVIGLVSKNITNVVAPLGTAVTADQIRVLKNYADSIVIMMDGDKAGRKAALNSSEIALNEGLEAGVILLEEGKDPFDISRQMTSDEIKKFLDKPIPASLFMIHEIMGDVHPGSTPEEKKKAVESLFQFVSVMKRETDRQAYLTEGAKKLGISETYVLQDYLNEKGSKTLPANSDKYKQGPVQPEKTEVAVLCERKIVAMLIRFPELFRFVHEIQEIEFMDEESAFAWEILYTRMMNQEGVTASDIIFSEEGKGESAIAPFIMENYDEKSEIRERIFRELILRQKIAMIDRKLSQMMKNGMFADEIERISKMAYYKTEKEKMLGYIRNLQ